MTTGVVMSRGHWLLVTAFALALYGVGNIWPVQLSSYRLWASVGAHEFHAYHLLWWRTIQPVIIAPAIALFVLALLMLRWRVAEVPRQAVWLGAALQLALLVGTLLWWAPLMAHLEDGSGALDPARYRLRLGTHWLRVALVTGYGALVGWMLVRSLTHARAAR